MKTNCPFLEVTPLGPDCSIGVNFRTVGEDGPLCEGCSLRGLDDTAYCRHVQADAFLGLAAGDRTVTVALGCALRDCELEDLVECQGCPAFEPVSPLGAEANEERGVLARSSARRP